jgi:flagellar biosynthesis chaperone FliJ
MKNLQQIKAIGDVLDAKKSKLIADHANIIAYIKRKLDNIQKFREYQKEYTAENHLLLSKSTPLLHKNLNSFLDKIESIILKEQHEIDMLELRRRGLQDEIEKFDQKINVMDKFEEKIHFDMKQRNERNEQSFMDDLAVNNKVRSDV